MLFWEGHSLTHNQYEIRSVFTKFLRVTTGKWKLPCCIRLVPFYRRRRGWGTWRAVEETLHRIITYREQLFFPTQWAAGLWRPGDYVLSDCQGFFLTLLLLNRALEFTGFWNSDLVQLIHTHVCCLGGGFELPALFGLSLTYYGFGSGY